MAKKHKKKLKNTAIYKKKQRQQHYANAGVTGLDEIDALKEKKKPINVKELIKKVLILLAGIAFIATSMVGYFAGAFY